MSTTDEATEAKTVRGQHFPARYPVGVADFLDDARQRVIIYDGATGTNLQMRQLGPDDFGGPSYEGCNEVLVDTRPDVVAELHRSFFDVGVDVVETDSFGSLPWVL